MDYNTTGEVIHKSKIQKINDKFEKQEIVIRTEDKYPQDLKFETLNPVIIEDCEVGDKLKVFFNIRGREWNEKYFVSLGVWRIEKIKDTEEVVKEVTLSESDDEYNDDFPF